MLAIYHATQRAQRLGKLFFWRHRRPLLAGHLISSPPLQLRHVGLGAGKPGFRGLVPHGTGRLGGDVLAIGYGEVYALFGGLVGLGWHLGSLRWFWSLHGRRIGSLGPLCERCSINAGRHVPGLLLSIPLRTQRLSLVLLLERHVDKGLDAKGGRFGLRPCRVGRRRAGRLLLLAVELGNAPLQVFVVLHGGEFSVLAGFFGR